MDKWAGSYRRFLDGDDEGLAEIVRKFKDGLILYLNTYAGDIYLADELAADTFFRLISKKPRFREKSSFKSWLYGIGRHVALDRLRRDAKRTSAPLEAAAAVKDEEELERSYLREERKIMLRKAIGRLAPEYGRVLWLVYFEELSNAEAATAMGKSDRQIRNLLYRAKKSLRSELDKEGFKFEE